MSGDASVADDARDRETSPNTMIYLLVVAFVLAFLLRLPFGLGFGLDDDEFYTLRNALEFWREPTPDAVKAHPLTFLAARIGLELGGFTVASLRWFPFVAGVLGVLALAWRGRRIVGAQAALAAAFLLCVWPWHQYFSGMARYYAPLFLAGVGIVDATYHLLVRPSPSRVVVLLLWVAVGVLLHPSAVFGLCGLASIVFDPRLRGRVGLRWLACSIVFFVALAFVLRSIGAWHNIERVLSQEGGEGANAIQLVFNLGFNLTPILLALSLVGAVTLYRLEPARARFLILAAGLPILLLATLAALGFGVQGRYAMAGFPALLWLAGCGIAALLQRAPSGAMATALIVAVATPCLPGVVSNLIDGDRQPVADVAHTLASRIDGDSYVYAESHGLLVVELFGFQRERPAGIGSPPGPSIVSECPPKAAELAVIGAIPERVWFAVRASDLVARGGDAGAFADWLARNTRIVSRFAARRFDYHRNELVVLERPSREETGG